MDFCRICDKVVVYSNPSVTCRGVCGKIVHGKCVTYHQRVGFDDWFCSTECREMDERFKRLDFKLIAGFDYCKDKFDKLFKELRSQAEDAAESGDSDESESSKEEDSGDEEEDNGNKEASKFTVKIWRMILQNFDATELASARLVCHLWKNIIDRSPSLVDKLVLNIPRGSTLDKHCELIKKVALSTLRHTRACLTEVYIVGAATWWPGIGGNLNSLVMIDCKISIEMLLDMLRVVPGLKRLSFTCGKHFICNAIPKIDFQLHSLEELFLADILRLEILDVFEQICPRLKMLRIPETCKIDGYNDKLINLVKGARRTLEVLEISGEEKLFDKLTDLNGLLLKRVILGNIDQDFMVHLSVGCPSFENISVACTKLDDESLSQIGDNLPKLTSLTVEIATDDSPAVTFLKCMPELEYLSLKCSNRPIHFGQLERHNLTSLTLQYAKQTNNWFKHFPNLRIIKLINCTIVGSWSNLFAPVAQLRKLQRLKLDTVKAETNSKIEYLPDYLESLTELDIRECDIPKESLHMMINFCPKLIMIGLKAVKGVDDDVGVVIGKNGKYLREIWVQHCAIHDNVFKEHVRKHCRGVDYYVYSNIQEGEDDKSTVKDERK